MGDVTRLLLRWRGGDDAALGELLPLVYQELRALALRHLSGERGGHTLQRTALVHEAYLRLVGAANPDLESRAQFFGLASQMMRRILVDHARRRAAKKRGSAPLRIDLDEVVRAEDDDAARDDAIDTDIDFEAVDEALHRLEVLDASQGRLVELRFFGGLSIQETATVLGASPATVKREWALARAWLQRELEPRP